MRENRENRENRGTLFTLQRKAGVPEIGAAKKAKVFTEGCFGSDSFVKQFCRELKTRYNVEAEHISYPPDGSVQPEKDVALYFLRPFETTHSMAFGADGMFTYCLANSEQDLVASVQSFSDITLVYVNLRLREKDSHELTTHKGFVSEVIRFQSQLSHLYASPNLKLMGYTPPSRFLGFKTLLNIFFGILIAVPLNLILNPFFQLLHSLDRVGTDAGALKRLIDLPFRLVLSIGEAIVKGFYIGIEEGIVGALKSPWENFNWKNKKGGTRTAKGELINNDSYYFGKWPLITFPVLVGIVISIVALFTVLTGGVGSMSFLFPPTAIVGFALPVQSFFGGVLLATALETGLFFLAAATYALGCAWDRIRHGFEMPATAKQINKDCELTAEANKNNGWDQLTFTDHLQTCEEDEHTTFYDWFNEKCFSTNDNSNVTTDATGRNPQP